MFIVVNRLHDGINLNDVDVKSNVQELSKFLLSLLTQVELAVVLKIVVDRVLVLVPGVSFERVKHVVVSCHEVIVVVELVILLRAQRH